MSRVNNLELPSADELREMIKKESPRKAFRRDYLIKNSEIFTDFRNIAKQAEIDDSILDTWSTTSFNQVIRKLQDLTNNLELYLTKNHQLYYLYDQLNCFNEPKPSELIFVFGAPSDLRITKAVELFNMGIAPKIMISGNAPYWGDNTIFESERMADFAMQNGVSANDIIIEKTAIAVPDNVKRSVDYFEQIGWRPKTITIVTSEFNLRRAVMDWYKFPTWDIEIFATAPTPNNDLNEENWIKTERGRRIILNEYAKLIIENKIDQVLAEGWG